VGGERAIVPVTSEDDPFRPPAPVAVEPVAAAADGTIRYRVTEAEFLSAVRRLQRPALVAMAVTAGVLVPAMLTPKLLTRGFDTRVISQIVVFVIILSVVLLVVRVVQRRAHLRTYRDLDMDDTVALTVQPDGLRFETTLTTARVPWDRITRISVTSDQILIHRTRGMAHIVPKRVFADQAAAAAFLDLVRRSTAR